MRETRILHAHNKAIVKAGWAAPGAWPARRGSGYSRKKGGDRARQLFKYPVHVMNKPIKEMKTLKTTNPTDSHSVNRLIRAAKWIREKGQIRPLSDTPELEEEIGILFNVV